MNCHVCLVCKTIPAKQSVLCEFCLAGLLRLREPFTRDEGRFRVRSLYAWRPNSPKALAWLVRSLKHHEEDYLWRELSAWMLSAFGPLHSTVIVPIPSASRHNHALALARALAGWTGFPVVPALSLTERRQQKRLRRGERQDIRFEREIWSFCTDYTNVVIVDDVVTTGGTARAAYHTLGRPQNCEVWCLLDRRPCGS